MTLSSTCFKPVNFIQELFKENSFTTCMLLYGNLEINFTEVCLSFRESNMTAYEGRNTTESETTLSLILFYYMSLFVRTPVFGVSDQVRHK